MTSFRLLVTYHRWQFLILEIAFKSWWNVGDRRLCHQCFRSPTSIFKFRVSNKIYERPKVAVEKSPIMTIGSRSFWKSRMIDCKSFDWAYAILTSFILILNQLMVTLAHRALSNITHLGTFLKDSAQFYQGIMQYGRLSYLTAMVWLWGSFSKLY